MKEMIEEQLVKHEEGIRYILFGMLTVFVSWGSYALFVIWIDPSISNAMSWIAAVVFAFFVNKYFVFNVRNFQTIWVEAIEFFSGRIFTGVVSILLFPVLVFFGINYPIFGVEDMLTKGIVSFVEIALNYLISKFIVFKTNNNQSA